MLLSDGHILVGTYPVGSDMTVGDDTKAEISFFAHLSSPMIPCRKPSTKKKKKKYLKFLEQSSF